MHLSLSPFFYKRLKADNNESILIIQSNREQSYHILGRKKLSYDDTIIGKTHINTYNIVKEDLIYIDESNDFHNIYIPKAIHIKKLPIKIAGDIDTDRELVLEVQIEKEI